MLYNIIFAQFSGISKYFASKYRTIPRTIVIKTGPSLVLTFHILSFPENHGKVFLISPGNCSHKIPLLLPQFSTKKNSRKVLDFSDFFFFFPIRMGQQQSKDELLYQQVGYGNTEGIKTLSREGAGLEVKRKWKSKVKKFGFRYVHSLNLW